jgi:hypothetical protein
MGHADKPSLKIPGQLAELRKVTSRLAGEGANKIFQLMGDMVCDYQRLGLLQRRNYRLHLLCDLQAILSLFDHLDDAREMAIGAAQAIDEIGIGGVTHVGITVERAAFATLEL